MTSETRNCQNCKQLFVIESDDFAFYEKIKVPTPTWCPECRLVRRFAWRNERSLHKRDCGKCGKSIISVFAPDSGLTVYCNPCWWSDGWNALDYGVDFDPKRPFLVQLRELLDRVPLPNLYGLYTTLQNSDYTNMVAHLKNCYMVTYSDYCENVVYGSFVNHTKDSVDNLMSEQNELCYDTVNCNKCYGTLYSEDCEGCRNLYFCKNCVGCSDCFGCANLRNKRYHVYNEPVSKGEFDKFVAENTKDSKSVSASRKKARDFWAKFPSKYMHGIQNSNVSGDYIFNSKNVLNSYSVGGAEDCRFCAFVTDGGLKDSYDFVNFGVNSSLLYEVIQAGDQISRIRFSWLVITSAYDVDYSVFIVGSKDIFGSIGVKRKEYCILNKQYPKDEYIRLREVIIDQMKSVPYVDKLGRYYSYGEFFPAEMSPFGYNETTAQEFFPLDRIKAIDRGFNWRKIEKRNYAVTLKAESLPGIENVKDAIVNEVISCLHKGQCIHQCSNAFRLVSQELQFYRKLKIPLPQLCPNCRHGERLARRNSIQIYQGKCRCTGKKSGNDVYSNTINHFHGADPCPNEFETSYAPERPEIVYCEACYNAEVA